MGFAYFQQWFIHSNQRIWWWQLFVCWYNITNWVKSHLFCLREVPLFTHEESKYSNRNGNVIKSMVSTNAVIYSNAYEMKILVEISIFDNQQLNIWVFSCNRCVYAVWHDAVRWIGCHIKRYKRPTVLIFTGQMWYFKRLLWLIQ